jgi:hypothetical protein
MRSRLVLAALTCIALVPAVAPLASAAPTTPKLAECNGTSLVVKPSSYMLACGDGGIFLKSLAWSSWTAGTAKASGSLMTNDCTPNCAAGTFIAAPATVTLTRPRTVQGSRVFTTITVRSTANGKATTETWTAPTPTR